MLPDWIQYFLMDYGCLAVFMVLLMCGLGIPLPEDIVLISAGMIVAMNAASFSTMLGIAYLGILLGDGLMYAMGWYWGPQIREKRFFKYCFNDYRVYRIESLFQKWGLGVIFVARFIPGLRAPIYVISGMTRRVQWHHFVFMDGLAALFSVPFFIWLGYYGAEHHEWLWHQVKQFKTLSFFVLFSLCAFFAFLYYRSWKRKVFFRRELNKRRMQREHENMA